jgi:subtilisin family serine protease
VSDPSIGYVAAAGAVDNVLCVAATDQSDVLASFSNFGAHSVDLAAPGVNVLSTSFDRDDVYAENGFATWFTPVPPATDASQGWQTYPAPGGGGTVIASDPPTFVGTPSTQVAGTTRATESQNIPVGTQYQECTFSFIAGANQAGDDAFSWSLTLDGTSVFDGPVADTDPTSGKNDLTFAVPSSPVTHQMRISFRFFHGASGATSPWAGAELLRLQCVQGNDRFDSGTSMATPMVTGTAALLFSLKPTATVSQARKAILKGVDPIAGLAGKTVTGGRLDAWRAMNAFLPLDTRITSGPSGHVRATRARFAFDTNKTGPATGYQCRLDATRWKSCTSPTSLRTLSLGKHTFRVRSVLPGGADTTPATRTWTIIK